MSSSVFVVQFNGFMSLTSHFDCLPAALTGVFRDFVLF